MKPGRHFLKLVVLVLTMVSSIAFACSDDLAQLDESSLQRVEDALTPMKTREVVPGAVIVAVYQGKTVVCRISGYANLEHQVEITLDSRFDMASVSKQFTALAILLLEQDGKLNLEDSVTDYLDWFPTVRFLRDEGGAIVGFNVTASRLRHAYFKKIDW